MSWYHYCQNNSGGSHEYDASRGISVDVYVEADSADEANERALEIGLYFDGVDGGRDCDCCGNRWYEETYAQDDDFEPPTEDEALLIDENARSTPMKWADEGNYDVFVHPKGKPFYGAHAEVERIPRNLNGYGLYFSAHQVGEVVGVSEYGWTADGNGSYPAPKSRHFADQTVQDFGNVRLEILDGYGPLAYRLWTSDKHVAETVQERVQDYIMSLPVFDPKTMLDGLVTKQKKPTGEERS